MISLLKRFSTLWDRGQKERLIAYGDIHGCLDELIKLRDKIEPNQKKDIEIALGDTISKGLHSKEVLKFLRSQNIITIMGNHEDKIVRYLEHEKELKHKNEANPISLNSNQKELINSLDSKNIEYLLNMPIYKKISNITLLHGGVDIDTNLESDDKKHLSKVMHMRSVDESGRYVESGGSNFWSEVYDGREGFIIYGHQVFSKPKRDKFALGIDTGCVYGNSLSCAILTKCEYGFDIENIEIVTQKAKRVYAKKG